MTKYVVVVPAGGSGQRMLKSNASSEKNIGSDPKATPKQFLQINGKLVIEHALDAFLKDPDCLKIVIPLQTRADVNCEEIFQHEKIQLARGGVTRVLSVMSGLTELARDFSEETWVMVHDAARPNLHTSDVNKLKQGVLHEAYGGILAVPSRNTLKLVKQGCVAKTLDRQQIWQALTPQMFRLGKLMSALNLVISENAEASDEASAMEYSGARVIIIEGRVDNLKLTYPEDLPILKKLIEERNSQQDLEFEE